MVAGQYLHLQWRFVSFVLMVGKICSLFQLRDSIPWLCDCGQKQWPIILNLSSGHFLWSFFFSSIQLTLVSINFPNVFLELQTSIVRSDYSFHVVTWKAFSVWPNVGIQSTPNLWEGITRHFPECRPWLENCAKENIYPKCDQIGHNFATWAKF